MSQPPRTLIFSPGKRAMSIAFFNSWGPGNLRTTLDFVDDNRTKAAVGCVVVDRNGTPGEALARDRGIEVLKVDFQNRLSGVSGDNRRAKAEPLFRELLEMLNDFEARKDPIDLCVLAFRQLLPPFFLERFGNRVINQHPADLTVQNTVSGKRRYVGIEGLARSLADGARETRTTTILVNAEMDGGEILVQGPTVPVKAGVSPAAHERLQKEISDGAALRCTLQLIVDGRLSVEFPENHPSHRRRLYLDGAPLPNCGVQLDAVSQQSADS